MKATLKVQGTIELSDQDLFEVLKAEALKNRQVLTPIISNFIKMKYGYTPVKIQYPAEGLEKIAAIIDSTTDEGATPIGVVKEKAERSSNAGYIRKWEGLYGSIGEIIDTLRARKKHSISWEDLRAELLDFQHKGSSRKMFIADGEEIPMEVIKQRCMPSQLARQKVKQPNLKGVKYDKETGLSF
jgi:hypothetical protein